MMTFTVLAGDGQTTTRSNTPQTTAQPMAHEIKFLSGTFTALQPIPYADLGVHAGFPSVAQDYVDKVLDFNTDIIRHPEATFYARVLGDSMVEAGIRPGDLIVVDRSIEPYDGCTAVCFVDEEFAIKEVDLKDEARGRIVLRARNAKYPPIVVTPDVRFEIWGVVAYVIHSCLR